jgi:hypothetical protein
MQVIVERFEFEEALFNGFRIHSLDHLGNLVRRPRILDGTRTISRTNEHERAIGLHDRSIDYLLVTDVKWAETTDEYCELLDLLFHFATPVAEHCKTRAPAHGTIYYEMPNYWRLVKRSSS